MELEIIRMIQRIRNVFFDHFFNLITELGDQYVFILVVVFFYWFINKKSAYRLVFVFLLSSAMATIIKQVVKRPRPYIQDEKLTVLRKTGGYSFPSGHSQAITIQSLFIYNESYYKNKYIKIILIFLTTIVLFSRMYLGQHYLTDVIAGLALGSLMYLLGNFLFKKMNNKEEVYALVLSFLISVILIILLFFKPAYESYHKIYIGAFGLLGFSVGYYLDKKYLKYEVKNSRLKHIYKFIIGVLGALLIYFVIEIIFKDQSLYKDAILYLLLGLWISIGSLYVFKKVVGYDQEKL
ncbi:Membrane-associated phospholipid phosphatase [Alteracholeplasma palmae J233]|uniref:Membrane-associated phospholipid phosphatase n=1 Tax=Alteracholeplasma palmae (strain ATCC 49389 / J233) TaxID=1318466 RepID=U4KRZ4_ALTPJ|nr:phosphatase PAP2 family protein [Alteracholeplasma palmae]CCV64576.1 Membrane-associated phospholipid phosphatase [Alteracholeplasma palmae J233]